MAVKLPDIDFCLEYRPAPEQGGASRSSRTPKKRQCKSCNKFHRIGFFVSMGYMFSECRECRTGKP